MHKSLLALWFSLTLSLAAFAQPTLQIEASPPDALIFVDREMRGKGKAVITDLPAGPHLLRVAAGEDYEPVSRTIQLGDQPLTLQFRLVPSGKKWIEAGRKQLTAGDIALARQNFAKAVKSQPVAGSWWTGVASYLARDDADALEAFRSYAHYSTDAPELHLLMGRVHQRLGQNGPAFTAFKTALLKKMPDALKGLPAATYRNIANLSQPKNSREKLRLAQLQSLKGNMPEALRWSESAVRDLYGDWESRDWAKFEPAFPKPPEIEVAPPEDTQEPR